MGLHDLVVVLYCTRLTDDDFLSGLDQSEARIETSHKSLQLVFYPPSSVVLHGLVLDQGKGYHVAGWVILASLEGKGEGVLSCRYEGASEVVEDVLKPGYLLLSGVLYDFFQEGAILDVSVLGRFIISGVILGV
jgi:hypothetical protein